MKKILLSVVFLTFFFLTAIQTFACDCNSEVVRIVNGKQVRRTTEEKIKEAFKESFSVFSGKVLSIKYAGPKIINGKHKGRLAANKRLVTFEVDKFWKNKNRKRVIISTGLDGGDCGFPFKVGKKYLVYAFEKDLWVSACSRTELFSQASEDLKVLNQLQKASAK